MFFLSAVTPPEAYDFVVLLGEVDIRRFLGAVRVPTLLLHRTADPWIAVQTSRYMAERIPGARLVELAGNEHLPFLGDQDSVVALTQEFLTSWTPPGGPPSSATAAGTAAGGAQRGGARQSGPFPGPGGQDHR